MRSAWATPDRVAVPDGLHERIASSTWAKPRWWQLSARGWRPVALAVPALAGLLGIAVWRTISVPVGEVPRAASLVASDRGVPVATRNQSTKSGEHNRGVVDVKPSLTRIPAVGAITAKRVIARSGNPGSGLVARVAEPARESRRPVMATVSRVRDQDLTVASPSAIGDRLSVQPATVLAAVPADKSAPSSRVSLGADTSAVSPSPSMSARVAAGGPTLGTTVFLASVEDDSSRSSYQDELIAQSEASRKPGVAGFAGAAEANRVSVVQAPVATGKR